MSSETSTERLGSPDVDRPAPDALQPWQLFTLLGLIGATVVVYRSAGHTPAGIILLSLMVFAAAAVGLAAMRTFLPLAKRGVESGPPLLGGRTRAALFREKALVLRSLKELEFDRAMKKVSDKDFEEMSARLRVRATGLIRQLDAGSGYRDEIRREVEKRLAASAARNAAHTAATTEGIDNVGGIRAVADRGPAAAAPAICPSCDTQNDIDAKFCKNCGKALEVRS